MSSIGYLLRAVYLEIVSGVVFPGLQATSAGGVHGTGASVRAGSVAGRAAARAAAGRGGGGGRGRGLAVRRRALVAPRRRRRRRRRHRTYQDLLPESTGLQRVAAFRCEHRSVIYAHNYFVSFSHLKYGHSLSDILAVTKHSVVRFKPYY